MQSLCLPRAGDTFLCFIPSAPVLLPEELILNPCWHQRFPVDVSTSPDGPSPLLPVSILPCLLQSFQTSPVLASPTIILPPIFVDQIQEGARCLRLCVRGNSCQHSGDDAAISFHIWVHLCNYTSMPDTAGLGKHCELRLFYNSEPVGKHFTACQGLRPCIPSTQDD